MGSKSSKWIPALLAATALAVVPAGAGATLDYSQNSVSGEVQGAVPAHLDYSRNAVSGEDNPAPSTPRSTPVMRPAIQSPQVGRGFAWGDALAGAGVALALALAASAIVRRRHAPLLGS
jgi:hypothetical protein